jgi:uncharacterized membrane protein
MSDNDHPDIELGTKVGRSRAARIRGYFFSGFLILAPLAITFWVTTWFIQLVDQQILPGRYISQSIPGAGILITLAVITFTGWATSGLVGRVVQRKSEELVARIPIIRSIYGATKQIFEAVLAKRSHAFRQVAIFEYPRKGVWSIGFLTGTTAGEVQQKTSNETVNVFVPTTPNPTSGFLLFVPRADLILLDMTVEEGIKMVVSGGIVTPEHARDQMTQRGATETPPTDA